MRSLLATVTLIGSFWMAPFAKADSIQVFAAGAVKAAVAPVTDMFQAGHGHTLQPTFDTVGALRDRVLKGDRPDVAILSTPAVQALIKAGIASSDAVVDIGRTGVGLAGRAGSTATPIATIEDFRRLLAGAASVGYADPARGATAGTLFARALADLGLLEPMRDRLRVFSFGVEAVDAVERGDIDVGVSQATEILTHPVAFLGYLPEPYQSWTPYQAVALNDRPATRQLLEVLRSARGVEAFQRIGFK